MKKNLIKLTLFALLIAAFLPLNAQDMQVNVKADTVLIPGSTGIIELNVTGGVAPFTYMLYDKAPWDGGKLIEKTSSIFDASYKFTIQNAGSYFIAISDKKEVTKFFTITIKAAGTSYIMPKSVLPFKKYLI